MDRVRPPRVQITYDVEVGGAIELKELPFVVGVLGDFTGQPEKALPKLKDRKFVEVNPDNFDTVLEGMKPHLAFRSKTNSAKSPTRRISKWIFNSRGWRISSRRILPGRSSLLRELLDLRTRLSDLRGSLQGNDKLEELLLEAVGNTENRERLKEELANEKGGGSNG